MAALPYLVTASKVAAAAGDYADNDIVSESASNDAGTAWTFLNMAPREGGAGEIYHAFVKCTTEGVAATSRLHLFAMDTAANASWSSELDDNAALNIDEDEMDEYLGFIDFPAMVDVGEFAFAQATGLSQGFKCKDGHRHLYGIYQLTDAETGEGAGMTVTIGLYVRPY